MAHKYRSVVVCFSRGSGLRSSWSHLPEGLKDTKEEIGTVVIPVVGTIVTQAKDPCNNHFDWVELRPDVALPPVSVWRWGSPEDLTSIVRGPVHKRCHQLYSFVR